MISPDAREPKETACYDLDEVRTILRLLPEPVATAFSVAAFAGMRHGEIQGLRWEDYRKAQFKDSNGEITELDTLWVTRTIWNVREGEPRTGKSKAPVPVIAPLRERLEMHRFRSSHPTSGEPNHFAHTQVL